MKSFKSFWSVLVYSFSFFVTRTKKNFGKEEPISGPVEDLVPVKESITPIFQEIFDSYEKYPDTWNSHVDTDSYGGRNTITHNASNSIQFTGRGTFVGLTTPDNNLRMNEVEQEYALGIIAAIRRRNKILKDIQSKKNILKALSSNETYLYLQDGEL